MLVESPAMTPRKPMSLRLRVLAAIAMVVVLGAAGGAVFAGWVARQALRDELSAAMTSGRQAVERALAANPGRTELTALIAAFDGDRHLVARLVDEHGAAVSVSRPPASSHPAPDWFVALLDPRLNAVGFGAPGGLRVMLTPAPADDAGDAWLQFGDALMVLGLVVVAGAGLVYVTIGRALRPLGELTAAFGRVGGGDYGARVAEAGPAELARLARSFNGMAGDLTAMQRRTRVLETQILKLQDEERAELARDLHDEIGPQLFAAHIDATMLGQSLAAGRHADAAAQVRAIQTAVGHIQRQVRDILSRLRPAQLVELGLSGAIGELVEFWRARRPDISFVVALSVADPDLPDGMQELVYRIVQEGLSNAIRHGRPTRIEVEAALGPAGELIVRVSDDGVGGAPSSGRAGFGLIGMRERIEAAGGSLSAGGGEASGWTIVARAPLGRSFVARAS
jgi:two-component system sensor histidine kinase UhpB